MVSTPVTWEELASAAKRKDASKLVFEAADVLKRVTRLGDLYAPVETLQQWLPGMARRNGSRAAKRAPRTSKRSA